ncbi:hypothetical protein VTL71DRAFT_9404 [Oculimacula yallundae]|uniref:Uncharacterized protein n=1 Tax=Oculimacula yallundae TaxID=86028 RepID=A0ABR4BSX9_9HELO
MPGMNIPPHVVAWMETQQRFEQRFAGLKKLQAAADDKLKSLEDSVATIRADRLALSSRLDAHASRPDDNTPPLSQHLQSEINRLNATIESKDKEIQTLNRSHKQEQQKMRQEMEVKRMQETKEAKDAYDKQEQTITALRNKVEALERQATAKEANPVTRRQVSDIQLIKNLQKDLLSAHKDSLNWRGWYKKQIDELKEEVGMSKSRLEEYEVEMDELREASRLANTNLETHKRSVELWRSESLRNGQLLDRMKEIVYPAVTGMILSYPRITGVIDMKMARDIMLDVLQDEQDYLTASHPFVQQWSLRACIMDSRPIDTLIPPNMTSILFELLACVMLKQVNQTTLEMLEAVIHRVSEATWHPAQQMVTRIVHHFITFYSDNPDLEVLESFFSIGLAILLAATIKRYPSTSRYSAAFPVLYQIASKHFTDTAISVLLSTEAVIPVPKGEDVFPGPAFCVMDTKHKEVLLMMYTQQRRACIFDTRKVTVTIREPFTRLYNISSVDAEHVNVTIKCSNSRGIEWWADRLPSQAMEEGVGSELVGRSVSDLVFDRRIGG